ncbi:MAG: class I SAM-dependent DNA methyltransferase [Smithellaceae bacterium]
MNGEKRNFDKEAASWDAKPERVKLVADIAQTIACEIKLTPSMDVLDFGCGTGLLTMRLQPFVRSITGVDSSQGMLDVLRAKIKDQNLTNVKTCYLDIEKDGVLEGSYHLIVSSMTFHHIKEIKPLLNQFYNILLPSGCLCIADLDIDDGRFHEKNDGVFHFGFDREKLSSLAGEAGFRDIRCQTAARLTKMISGGEDREFTIFLLTCGK